MRLSSVSLEMASARTSCSLKSAKRFTASPRRLEGLNVEASGDGHLMAARRADAGRANIANGCRGVLHIARGFSGAETDSMRRG